MSRYPKKRPPVIPGPAIAQGRLYTVERKLDCDQIPYTLATVELGSIDRTGRLSLNGCLGEYRLHAQTEAAIGQTVEVFRVGDAAVIQAVAR